MIERSYPQSTSTEVGHVVARWLKRVLMSVLACVAAGAVATEANIAQGRGGAPDSAGVELLVLLKSDPDVLREAKAVLHRPDLDVSMLLPVLAEAARGGDENVSSSAGQALGEIGGPAVPAVLEVASAEVLSSLDQDADWPLNPGERPRAVGAVPALIMALEDRSPRVRYQAAEALGNIGPAASAGVDALKRALQDPDVRVREAARTSVLSIQSSGK